MQAPAFPPAEEPNPRIGRAVTGPVIVNVLREGSDQEVQQEVFVVGEMTAYKRIEWMHDIPISHGGPDWGFVCFGKVLPRVPGRDEVFHEAKEERVQVAIKRLQKNIFLPELQRENPTRENPYREIFRMQALEGAIDQREANVRHFLTCVEAIEDENFLYIITPFCDGGDLLQNTPLQPAEGLTTEAQAKIIYRKMLNAMRHMHDGIHDNGICHRDIKPGNFLVSGDDILLADFAMSFPIPQGTEWIHHIGTFGTPQYLPPEIAREVPFNCKGCDLWACTITLFNILTGMPVYMRPLPDDIFFVFSVMARALSETPSNEMIEEIIRESNAEQFHMLRQLNQRIMTFSPELRNLLGHVLALAPGARWTYQDVMASEWMNS